MTILSLKKTLLCCLQHVLFGDYEASSASFTKFSYVDSAQSYSTRPQTLNVPSSSSIWRKIPVQKKVKTPNILYVSAVPQLFLSSSDWAPTFVHLKENAEKTKEETVQRFKEVSLQVVWRLQEASFQSISSEPDHKSEDHSLLFKLWSEFQIETQGSGWISFRLTEQGIGLWLEHLQRLSASRREGASNFLPCPSNGAAAQPNLHLLKADTLKADTFALETMLWQVQYTYARCCLLLRQWQDIRHNAALRPDFPPTSLPAAGLGVADLRSLMAGSGERLIHALIEMTDDMFWIPYRWPSQQYSLLLKSAAQLCQSFEAFYAERLSGFGGLPSASGQPGFVARLDDYQANFYLAAAAKKVLQVLLSECLEAETPADL